MACAVRVSAFGMAGHSEWNRCRAVPAACRFRARLRAILGVADDAFVIGLVARFTSIKRHDLFLAAAGTVLARRDACHFALIGEGCTAANAELVRLAGSLSRLDRVHLLGAREDVADLTAGLDIAACTSAGEGFSNTIAEALACGIPCVVSDVGDNRRLLADAGLVFEAGNADALARSIMKLLAMSPHERRALGQQGRTRIEREFSIASCIANFNDLYAAIARPAGIATDGQDHARDLTQP